MVSEIDSRWTMAYAEALSDRQALRLESIRTASYRESRTAAREAG
jgi:hypothetical protein